MEEETNDRAVASCVVVDDTPENEPTLIHKLTLNNGTEAHNSLHTASYTPSNQNVESIGNSSRHTQLIGDSEVSSSSYDFKTKDVHSVTNSASDVQRAVKRTDDNNGSLNLKAPFVVETLDTTAPCAERVQCFKLQVHTERSTNSMSDLSHKKRHPLFSSQSLHNVQNLRNRSRNELSKSLRNFDLHILCSFKDFLQEDKFDKEGKVNFLENEDEDTKRSRGEISEAEAETGSALLKLKDQHSSTRREDTSSLPPPPPPQKYKLFHSFLLTFVLLRDRTFFTLFISNFFTCLSYSTPLIFLVDRAVDNYIGKTMAAILLSVAGVGNILGRLFFGVIADRLFSSPLVCYIAVVCLNAVSTMLSPLCGELVALHVIYAFLYGLSIGAIAVLAVMVTIELMGRDKVAAAFGLYLLSAGVGSVLGPPLGGWLFDWTQTYTLTYIVTGFFTLFSAVILLPLEVSRRRRRCDALPSDSDSDSDSDPQL